MNKKKIVYRQCIVTKKVLLQKDLIRIVRLKNNNVMIDLENKILGRGFYIQKELVIFQQLKKRMLLEKIFKREKSDSQILEIYDLLTNIIKNNKK